MNRERRIEGFRQKVESTGRGARAPQLCMGSEGGTSATRTYLDGVKIGYSMALCLSEL